MSFDPDSIKTKANTFFNNALVKGKEYYAEFEENPGEFLKTNGKVLMIATAFFTSLILAPLFTAGAFMVGFLYAKNVTKVENEYLEFFQAPTRSSEIKFVSLSLLAGVLILGGKIVLPIALGAHVGMLLSNNFESVEGKTPTPNPV
jgi:hypothetical protein